VHNRSKPYSTLIVVAALIIFGLIALTWGNLKYTRQNPGGNDFLVHWVGTRVLVQEGISPYSDEAAVRIQTAAYGRPAQPGEHELRVAYPLYSIIFFLPFALISDFSLARALWMTLLEVALVGLTVFSIRLANWKPNRLFLVLFLVFSVLFYHSVRPIINGNAILLVGLFIAGGFLAMRNRADELAGVLFAFATIKPHIVLILLVYVLIWSYKQKRWRLIGWLIGSVFLLSASAALLIPDWILQNLREVLRYPGYNPPGTLRAALTAVLPGIGSRIGWAISALLGIVLMIEWWLSLRMNFRGFFWVACLTLTISQWIGIQTDPGNFIILMPALVLVFSLLGSRWKRAGQIFVSGSIALLLIGLWALFLATVEYGVQPQQSPLMFLPLPLYLLVTLYWVRWWAVGPPNMWFDSILDEESPVGQ